MGWRGYRLGGQIISDSPSVSAHSTVYAWVICFVNIIIARSKQQMDPANPEESIKQNIIFRRRWSLFIIISSTMMVLLFTLPQVSFVYPIDPFISFIITMVVVGVIVIGAGVLSIVTGQGGSRVNVTNRKTGQIMNRDDDRYWKLGVFTLIRMIRLFGSKSGLGAAGQIILPDQLHGSF